MMKSRVLLLPFFFLAAGMVHADEAKTLSVIAFGSCNHQGKPQEHWQAITEVKPDLFVMLGDNIYGDTRDMKLLEKKWQGLADLPGYQQLQKMCPIEAVWDDHDYGENDAGSNYPMKKESQKIFLDFLEVDPDDPRRHREGTYAVKNYGPETERVQLILLDTRYFRGPLLRKKISRERGEGFSGPYVPHTEASSPLLGEAQWDWLKKQLQQPAKLRVIASSIQFVANDHGWEKWGNQPHERERMMKLIDQTQAGGVVFLSGDRHRAEISRLVEGVPYPVFDVTSSGMNNASSGFRNEVNVHRYGSLYGGNNFGSLIIDWTAEDPEVRMQIRSSDDGKVVIQHTIRLSEISGRDR